MAPRPQRAPAALELVVKLQRKERPEERSGETRPRQGSRAKSRRAEQPHVVGRRTPDSSGARTNVALERDGGDRRSCDWQVHDEHPLQARFVDDHAAEDGPEDRRQEHRQPEDGERPADCCGPARCATSVSPIGTTMTPRPGLQYPEGDQLPAVSTARTGTSRHRRARSPRPRRLGAAALGGPSGQGSGPPARRGATGGRRRSDRTP